MRLLNDLDTKDLFERHADIRHIETLALGATGIAVSILLFLIASTLQNSDPVEVKLARTAWPAFFVGSMLSGLGAILYWRLAWLWKRASAAMARLARRNELDSDTTKLAFHHGLAAAVPPYRFLRMEGLAALPIVVGFRATLYGVALGLKPFLSIMRHRF